MPKYRVYTKDHLFADIECDRMVFNQFGHILFLKKPAIIDAPENSEKMILLAAYKEFESVGNIDGKLDA